MDVSTTVINMIFTGKRSVIYQCICDSEIDEETILSKEKKYLLKITLITSSFVP